MRTSGAFTIAKTLLIHGAAVKDISESGVCIQLKQCLSIGAVVTLQLRLGDAKNLFQEAARVVWTVPKRDHKFPHEAGLMFTGMHPDDFNLLREFILHNTQPGAKNVHWVS
ncbi:MAG: PilZ domain-containing protein [Candidatus Omnitrophica bacterium]|nr:PilZ domain-containing protein [Candidatus Omnitrophota bacterium]